MKGVIHMALSEINKAILIFISLSFLSTFGQSNPDIFKNTWYGFNTGNFDDRYPTATRTADLDNDGDIDAAVSEGPFGSGFAVIFNDGNGFFSEPVHYATIKPTYDIALADFNSDTYPDVVVSNTGYNWEGNTISVFFNNGDGTFGSPVNLVSGAGPIGLCTADFDLDGDIDIAAGNYGYLGQGNTVSIFYNDGVGNFGSQSVFPAGNGPYKIACGLINGDDYPDIVAANSEQKLSVLMNSGGTDFSSKTEYSIFSVIAGDFYQSVTLGDVDNDGDTDVLYASSGTQSGGDPAIALLKNSGNGTLGSPIPIQLSTYTGSAVSVAIGDLNGDGWKDIVGASFDGRNTDGFQVILNNGSGGFSSNSLYPAGQATFSVALADVNNDGTIDVLTGDNYSVQVTVRLNPGNGVFFIPELYYTNSIAGSLDAADIDLDGDLDVVTSAWGRAGVGSHVAVLKNNGDGSFGSAVSYPVRSGGIQAKFRDLNNDGYPDLIFATSISSPPYDFHTAINNGDGTFGSIQTWPVGSCGWSDIDAFDVDNDGDLDAVITEWLGCPNIPESAQRIFISKNNGDGTFGAAYYMVVDPFPDALAGNDLNGDGIIDLVTGHSNSIDVSIGTGGGEYLPPVVYATELSPQDIVIDDFNDDGIYDIAASTFSSVSGMSVLVGNGDGTFQSAQNYEGAYSPDLLNVAGIASGDVDGDMDIDILVANEASNDMSIYFNNGDGTFSYHMRAGVYWSAMSPVFADFTGDGFKDVAALGTLPPGGFTSAVVIMEGKYGAVPVELTSFSASLNQDKVILYWSTSTEINNRGFYIERKSAGSWSEIGFVPGSGTISEPRSYSFADDRSDIPEGAKIYYRLKQVDYDGHFEYSNQVEAELTPQAYYLSQNYPNPFNPSTNIKFTIPVSGNVKLKIFDVLGNEVRTLLDETRSPGTYEINFNASALSSGVYFYSLEAGKYSSVKKMIMMK